MPPKDRREIVKKTSLTRAHARGGRVLAEHRAINGTMLYSGIAAPTIGSGQPDAMLAYAHTHIHIQILFKHIRHLVTLYFFVNSLIDKAV